MHTWKQLVHGIKIPIQKEKMSHMSFTRNIYTNSIEEFEISL